MDVIYKARQALPDLPDHPSYHVTDQLVEQGRLGQKSGGGFYDYDPQTRQRMDSPDVEAMIRKEAKALGIPARQISDEEIVERVIYPLVNEGALILEEGIAQRPGDIDIVYLYGYGFPAHRGGPMFYADTIGPHRVYDRICAFRDTLRADDWQPAPLLRRLAETGGKFG
jgi:3-hydroxyacyl-CoA dehydrogenase